MIKHCVIFLFLLYFLPLDAAFSNLVLFNPNYRLVRVYLMGYYEFYRDFYFTLGVFTHIWGQEAV